MHPSYFTDSIRAVDAKFNAQKIAFAPLSFEAARTLRDTGILEYISSKGDEGATISEISSRLSITVYGVSVLLEMGLGMDLVKLLPDQQEPTFILAKTGFFILEDTMTRVNMDFCHDVCYLGAFSLKESIVNGKPEGLKALGEWKTVYEGLSRLDPAVQKSWFDFDHFYSDIAFPQALPIVYGKKPKKLFDIGGNTAKWAIASCTYDPDVHVTILDLPGQVGMARENIAREGLSDRIDAVPVDMLSADSVIPPGADAVWMSQFLDCFSLEQVGAILAKVAQAVDESCNVFVLEPFWDKQRFEAASYSLQATSLYFTCIANGNSKMYRSEELTETICNEGFELTESHHNLGSNAYSLLCFRKK